MNIGINTQLLLKDRLEGIGWFSYENLRRITTQHKEHKFFFIFDRPYDRQFIFSNNIVPIVTKIQSRHPVLWYYHFEKIIPQLVKQHHFDLFVSLDGWTSSKMNIKNLYTIHDLNFEHYPKNIPFFTRRFFRHYIPKYIKNSTRVVTVSEFSKNDIVNKYGTNPNKIDVVYNGVNEGYSAVDLNTKKFTRYKYANGNPYFVYVGSINPRKNIANLLKAFDLFKQISSNNVNLVIVGSKMWGNFKDIDNVYRNMKHQSDVLFTGRLGNEELNRVVSSALAMVYVSMFEGFGIPILEAMKCETPVITSNVTSMPEVAGDAAYFVDPFSVDSIANAMNEMFVNENLRNSFIEKGTQRVNDFSWQQTADLLWQSIEKTMENK